MKRILLLSCVLVGLALSTGKSQAYWSSCTYSGYQPSWNLFAKRYKCLTPEEARLQKFWADYYDALKHYYKGLSRIDWVAYYKNHGYLINNGCGTTPCGGNPCCSTRNYAPIVVIPGMQWAVPNNCMGGPPCGPACGPGPMGPGMGPMGPMGPGPGPMGPGM